MSALSLSVLPDRAVIGVTGPEADSFLQGLVSNDVSRAGEDRVVYATLLTPQGKFLFDFFVMRRGDTFFLECEAGRKNALMQRLALYRLRADVEIVDRSSDWVVGCVFGEAALAGMDVPTEPGAARRCGEGWIYVDPRLVRAGGRVMVDPAAMDALAGRWPVSDVRAYDLWRLALALPDGSRDMVPEGSFLLESNIDDFNGISWDKGCYIGQETTARTRHRAAVRKRLLPVVFAGATPAFDTPLTAGEVEVGRMRSGVDGAEGADGRGLALVRLAPWQAAVAARTPLRAGSCPVDIVPPAWLEDGGLLPPSDPV